MILALWAAGLALVVLLLLAAAANLALRARPMLAVGERLDPARRDRELQWLSDVYEELVLATATLRTLATLALVLLIVEMCDRYELEHPARNAVSFASAFVLMLVFGVAVPAAGAKYAAGAIVTEAIPIFHVLHIAAYPVIRVVQWIDAVVRRLFGVPDPTPESEADVVEQEILNVVSEGELQGAVGEHETQMIRSVMEFRDTVVEEVMTPRTDIIAIEKTATLDEAKKLIAETGHSRVPIYDGTVDNIIGVLYAKDLLLVPPGDPFDPTSIMRHVPYIPDNKPVSQLLQELKDKKVHMAIVLDEYGGTSGLITIEDIVEELVGEIADEYEPAEPAPIKRVDENTVEVDARMRIDELNSELNIELPEHDDYETIGGLVFSSLGKIPRSGEHCLCGNVHISVLSAEPRKINRLRLHIMPTADGSPDSNGR